MLVLIAGFQHETNTFAPSLGVSRFILHAP
jgi:microcystin degradation protein MlrC